MPSGRRCFSVVGRKSSMSTEVHRPSRKSRTCTSRKKPKWIQKDPKGQYLPGPCSGPVGVHRSSIFNLLVCVHGGRDVLKRSWISMARRNGRSTWAASWHPLSAPSLRFGRSFRMRSWRSATTAKALMNQQSPTPPWRTWINDGHVIGKPRQRS